MTLAIVISVLSNCVFSIGIATGSDNVSWLRIMEAEMRQLKDRIILLESHDKDCCRPPSTTAVSDDAFKESLQLLRAVIN